MFVLLYKLYVSTFNVAVTVAGRARQFTTLLLLNIEVLLFIHNTIQPYHGHILSFTVRKIYTNNFLSMPQFYNHLKSIDYLSACSLSFVVQTKQYTNNNDNNNKKLTGDDNISSQTTSQYLYWIQPYCCCGIFYSKPSILLFSYWSFPVGESRSRVAKFYEVSVNVFSWSVHLCQSLCWHYTSSIINKNIIFTCTTLVLNKFFVFEEGLNLWKFIK